MNYNFQNPNLSTFMKMPPTSWATIYGSENYPQIKGTVRFYQTAHGVLTVAEIKGLPQGEAPCESPIFAFHIHEGEECSSDHTHNDGQNIENVPFSDSKGHYNPQNCPHPYHAGDLPPLFGSKGYAFLAFISSRFTAKEIIGKTVIIHSGPDDFTSQPSGNPGSKIACGEIIGM